MDNNFGNSLATAPQKLTLRQRFVAFSAFIGLVLFAWGTIPMAASIVDVSRAIDDGVQPGEGVILDEWERWAFSPRFVGLALCGVGIVAAALLWKRPGWRALAIVFTLITALFAYDAHERRKLVPPADLTLDTFFDWHPGEHRAVITLGRGGEHVIVYGQLRGLAPSGSSAYAFDKSGKLIDWTDDSGDNARFQKQWTSNGPSIQINRDWATQWGDKAMSDAHEPAVRTYRKP